MALGALQFTCTDRRGNVVGGATVKVYNEATGALASIYSDRAGSTVLGNPFYADADGYAIFYADIGEYRVVISGNGYTRTLRYVPIAFGEINAGVTWEGAWITATAYGANDIVENGGDAYICTTAHTSGASSEPGVGGSWETYWDLLAEGGIDGVDGSTILSGSGAPGGGTGVDGDFYINTANWNIYGPKAGGSWPAGVALEGTDGVSLNWEGAWVTATAYAVNDGVSRAGSSYICKLGHTSGGSSEPGTGGSWTTYWDVLASKGTDGLGAGDVVGPATATANAVALFDGTTGELLKDSVTTIDTDGTLAANSDTRLATQKAVKTYADALIAANDAMVFLGVIDCSANPNYPAASRGATYRVSVAGKIGGGSGPNVEAGDMLICLTDGTSSGNHATVGAQWSIIQVNLDGALLSTHIGSTVQAYDLLLTNIGALSMIADRMIYGTGTDAVALATLTAAGRALLDDADAAAQRITLGLSGAFSDIASATTTDLSSIAGIAVNVTGTTTITGFGTGPNLIKIVKFASSLLLTHGASLVLPRSLNISTAGGDVGIFVSDGSGAWRCVSYMPFTGFSRLIPETLVIAVSDETTDLTTGTAKVTFRMPWALTLTSVRASLTTVSSSGTPTIDINEGGTSILSTKLTIDVSEKTSTTAATAAVISDTSLADDAEMTIDIDTAGTGAKGLKVYLIGYRNG